MNAMFQNIGYATVPATRDPGTAFAEVFPILKDNFPELRKWTMRVRVADQVQKAAPAVVREPEQPRHPPRGAVLKIPPI
jgi:hypothetical protein